MNWYMSKMIWLGLVAAAIGWAAPAYGASSVVPANNERIELDMNKGALIRLERPASTVFIANPDIADVQVKSPRLIYIFGKLPGETTLYAVDDSERVLTSRPIAVSHNLSRLNKAMQDLLPDSRINARSVDASLVLSGSVETAADAEDARRLAQEMVGKKGKVVLQLDVTAPNQVNLRVRIAEVSRAVLKQLGIDWDAFFQSSTFLFGLFTGNPFVSAAGAITLPNDTNSIVGSGGNTGHFNINGLLNALEDEGLITVLAEPNLTAVNGKPATFLAGGEFPIVVPGQDNRVTVEFKEFGVSLAFTPTIIGRDRISLEVSPEVSQLSEAGAVQLAGFSIPALTTRRAKTTVELGSGQSFAIAGLIQNNLTHDIDKFPGLGDVPVLGALFRSDRFQRNETELVIVVTPYVVRPVSADKIALPTDGLTPPSDRDRILYGRTHRPTLQRGPREPRVDGGKGLSGPAGFVLE